MEVLRVLEVLADQLGADHLAVLLEQAAVGLMRKDELRDAGDGERIDKARDDGHSDDHHDGGTDLSEHGCYSSSQTDRGDDKVDGLDADERHDDAADPVDHEVAAQNASGAGGLVADAAKRERD